MNSLPDFPFWLRTLGVPALQVTVALAVAGLVATRLRSARSQRAAWLATFAATGLLVAAGLLGADRGLTLWVRHQPLTEHIFRVRTNLAVESATRPLRSDTQIHPMPDENSAARSVDKPPAVSKPVWWPAWGWLAGMAFFAGRQLVWRGVFLWYWRRYRGIAASELVTHVEEVARRLGVGGRIRVMVSPALVAPIAFGALRPTVGLPAEFAAANGRREREAMLAHELAHLSARDPFWLGLADIATIVLWWHPLAWWARRQLRAACETAADEASLLVEDGPAVLANCLVTLAARLPARRAFGLLGMAGFRSDLGRRVERLLQLRGGALRSATPRRVVLAALGVTTLAVTLALASAAWAMPRDAAAQPTLLALAQHAMAPAVSPPANPPSGVTGGAADTPASEASAAPMSTAPTEIRMRRDPDIRSTPPYVNLVHNAEPPPRRRDEAGPQGPRVVPATDASQSVRDAVPTTNQLFTRVYRLDPHTVRQSLESMAGRVPTNQPLAQMLKAFFEAAGVDFGTADSFPTGTDTSANQNLTGKAVFYYKDGDGRLLVRARQQDLDTVETALQMLNTSPPQVMIEAKFVEFVEIMKDDARVVAFEGHNAPPVALDSAAGTNAAGTNVTGGVTAPGAQGMTGIMTDPQFAKLLRAVGSGATNGVRELRGDELDWSGRQATNAHDIRFEAALGASMTGILTDAQFRHVMRAWEQRRGVNVLSAPKVTTLSGRQAQLQVVDMQSVVTAGIPGSSVAPPTKTGTNLAPSGVSTVPVGSTLDVIPTVAADGRSIELTVIPTVTEFLGYDSGPDLPRAGATNGHPTYPLPHFRVCQMATTARVLDGQTLVLSGITVENKLKMKDKVPVLGDLPLLGSLFRSESERSVKKHLVVFVTATIIDPAGNPIHAASHGPSDPNLVPSEARPAR